MTFSDVMQRKAAVLFDVDGTLVDTKTMILRGLGESFSFYTGTCPSDDDLLAMMGIPLREQMDYYGMDQRTTETNADRCSHTIDCYMKHRATQTVFEGTARAFALCGKHGLKTALVTSRNAREVQELLHDFPVFRTADAIVSSSDVAHPKPAADSALLACDRLGVQPDTAVFLGDSIFDLQCANSAGVTAIAVTYGAGTLASLQAHQPAWTFHQPEEVLAAFTDFLTPCEKQLEPKPVSTLK